MHGVEFERYMRIAISVMTEHMSEIEFEKDNRGTIIGYKSDSISKEVLESVMPWNFTFKKARKVISYLLQNSKMF